MKEIVFATNNPHKLSEARRIAGDAFAIRSLDEIGCHDDIPETADTLEGNAKIKALWVKQRYGYDCFADDTGLMVDALNGAPGVMTARFAGEDCTPDDNIDKLIRVMEGIKNRNAHFSTVIALAIDDRIETFEGSVEGSIATARIGTDGFGYDPIFIPSETGLSFAQMGPDAKNEISHRGRAVRKLMERLIHL